MHIFRKLSPAQSSRPLVSLQKRAYFVIALAVLAIIAVAHSGLHRMETELQLANARMRLSIAMENIVSSALLPAEPEDAEGSSVWKNAIETLWEIREDSGLPFVLLQLDVQGAILQHSAPLDLYPALDTGEFMATDARTGVTGGILWYRSEPVHGQYYTLLLPTSARTGASVDMAGHYLAAFAIGALLAVAAGLYNFVTARTVKRLRAEFDKAGDNNLETTDWRTGVSEFDALLDSFDAMKRRIHWLMEEAAREDKQHFLAEVDKLRYQINPHFLLNTMNSIHWLAVMNQQPDIDQFVSKLSLILNYGLGKTDTQPTLRMELSMLRVYLEIENMRHEFTFDIHIEEGDYLDMPVERMLLQPIAENAVAHGLDEQGHLVVDVKKADGHAVIRISDDGCGIASARLAALNTGAAHSTGVGLRYVYIMLKKWYGESAAMRIDSEEGKGTAITLALPLSFKPQQGGIH